MSEIVTRHGMTFKRPEGMSKAYFNRYIIARVGKHYTKDDKPWGHDSPYRIA